MGKNRQYSAYLASRPKEAENQAIALLVRLCREYRTRTHIVHLSSSDALTPIFHARSAGLPITAEACPHYLYFVAEEIPDGGTAFKCAPPIRERENREIPLGSPCRRPYSNDCVGPFAGAPGVEARELRRLLSRMGWHLVAPAQPVGHLDRGIGARLLPESACRVDVPRTRRLAGSNRKALEVGTTPTSWCGIRAAFTVDAGCCASTPLTRTSADISRRRPQHLSWRPADLRTRQSKLLARSPSRRPTL